jgi:hypothetical protein
VGEAHFCAVDDAIADAFDEGEDVVVLRVEDDALERFLESRVSLAKCDTGGRSRRTSSACTLSMVSRRRCVRGAS